MDSRYDIVVIGAGISGSFAAAAAAKTGAKVLLLEKLSPSTSASKPFAVYMMHRDYMSLELDIPSGSTVTTGFVNVTGSKIAFDFTYPDESAWFSYLRSDAFVNTLRRRIEAIPGITLRYDAPVVGWSRDDERFTGVVLSTGEKIDANICLFCAGLEGLKQLGLEGPRDWPAPVERFTRKVKIVAALQNGTHAIVDGLQQKSYEFYQKGTFDFYIMHGFGDSVCCEGQFADGSRSEAEQKFRDLFSTHPVAAKLLQGIDLHGITPLIFETDRFGVLNTPGFPGLLICGAAMGIDSPAYLSNCSTYYAVSTAKAAGEIAGEWVKSGNPTHGYIDKYDERWRQCLSSLKYDFDIVNGAGNQLEIFGKWINSALENYDEYYPRLFF